MTITSARQPGSLHSLAVKAILSAIGSAPPGTTPEQGACLIADALLRTLLDDPGTITTAVARAAAELAAESPDQRHETVFAGPDGMPWLLTVRAVCPDLGLAARRIKAAGLAKLRLANEHAAEYHALLDEELADLGAVPQMARRSA